jgi:hypothetical protein
MTDGETVVVCMPAWRPPPIAGTTRRFCNECGTAVWLAPSSEHDVPDGRIACLDCVVGWMLADGRYEVRSATDAQRAEFAAAGVDPDDADRVVAWLRGRGPDDA